MPDQMLGHLTHILVNEAEQSIPKASTTNPFASSKPATTRNPNRDAMCSAGSPHNSPLFASLTYLAGMV